MEVFVFLPLHGRDLVRSAPLTRRRAPLELYSSKHRGENARTLLAKKHICSRSPGEANPDWKLEHAQTR